MARGFIQRYSYHTDTNKKAPSSGIRSVFSAFVLLSFHSYIIQYVNSSFLEQFVSADQVGLLFSAGAVLTIIFLLLAPTAIKYIGAYRLTQVCIIVELLLVGMLAVTTLTPVIIIIFTLYRATLIGLVYIFDLYLESVSKEETSTGRIRGLYLTLSNVALIISPSIAGLLLGDTNFERVYIVSALFMIPILYIFSRNLRGQSTDIQVPKSMHRAISVYIQNRSLRRILAARFMLQMFYAWMVIYTPVYLFQVMGFSWQQVGFMLTLMLLPFALFQFPAGYLADKKYGERELLILGFVIMAIATYLFSLISIQSFIAITAILFISRIGASVVETMTESYFFKQVDEDNSNIISVFRATSPLSYVIGPLIGSLILAFTDFPTMFAVLGVSMFLGALVALKIRDTK